ncbi:unnamed protein product [Symbiodinium sp. KB8]|nr:unnamed protein product [Symbiodinium sp. KB8]
MLVLPLGVFQAAMPSRVHATMTWCSGVCKCQKPSSSSTGLAGLAEAKATEKGRVSAPALELRHQASEHATAVLDTVAPLPVQFREVVYTVAADQNCHVATLVVYRWLPPSAVSVPTAAPTDSEEDLEFIQVEAECGQDGFGQGEVSASPPGDSDAGVEVQSPALSLEMLFALPDVLSRHLTACDSASLRAVCRDFREKMPQEVFLEYFMNLMQLSKPGIFVVTGSWCKAITTSDGDELQACDTGLWCFFKGINAWHRTWPDALLVAARELREHCLHPEESISKNAQWTMAVWAGHCFQSAKSKGIRHFFVKDMLYWLRHADDDVRVEICRAFGKCVPVLLGRFNVACVQALAEACGANSSEACRSSALQALKLFAETDTALYQKIRASLLSAYRTRRGLYRSDISGLIAHMDVENGFRAVQELWHASVDVVSNSIALTVSSLSNFQQLVNDPFRTCAMAEVVETTDLQVRQAMLGLLFGVPSQKLKVFIEQATESRNCWLMQAWASIVLTLESCLGAVSCSCDQALQVAKSLWTAALDAWEGLRDVFSGSAPQCFQCFRATEPTPASAEVQSKQFGFEKVEAVEDAGFSNCGVCL